MELAQLLGTNLTQKSDSLYVTDLYESAAGNSYYSSVVCAAGLAVKEDIGEGYAHRFLNHLEIYSLKDKTLIADKSYHCVFYSKFTVIQEIARLLLRVFREALGKKKIPFDKQELEVQVSKIASDIYEAKN